MSHRCEGAHPMKIGLFSDGLMHLGFNEALAKAASLGVQAIEIGTGNFSPAPHCDLNRLLGSSAARDEFLELLEWQWLERVIPFWLEMAEVAKAVGVRQLCFELHPGMCVYNVSSFHRLRSAVGEVVTANLDPSHFFFQGMDPLAVIR